MPWKDFRVEHLRMEFVLLAQEQDANLTELCRHFGFSRKTGYKWLRRYREQGVVGLRDDSRRPKSSPLAVSGDMVAEIVRLRIEHPYWGPRKLRHVLLREHAAQRVPAVSTIARVLARSGLSQSKGRGRPRRWEPESLTTPAAHPNGLWTIDFKGYWRTKSGQRCEPLSVRDAHSRYILGLDVLKRNRTQEAQEAFRVLFERYGLPEAIRTDNGAPFASMTGPYGLTRLSAWWKMLGIRLERIRPGHPEENGGHERMHYDMARELEANRAETLEDERKRLERWRIEYNMVRPHEALQMKTPAEVYRRSSRRYQGDPQGWAYPVSYDQRRVRPTGTIKVAGRHYFISEALAGWQVGIEHLNPDTVQVWFCDLCLGKTDRDFRSPLHRPGVETGHPE